MTKVAIVTADFNDHKDTLEFLESSEELDTKGLEILWLIVDNGSDESVKNTVEKFPGVTWLQTGKNLGFAGGFNRGMKYAKEWGADYVLIINNDTLFPDKNLLQKLIKVLERNPKAGIVSPKIYFAPEFEFYRDRYSKEETGKVIWYAGGRFDWNNVRSVHRGIDEVDKGQFSLIEKTDFISGACVLIRHEVLEKVGYFEDKLFAYYEDSDWVERIKKAGYEQWYCGSAFIYHKVSRTSGIGSSWSDYLITRNRLWFGIKYANRRTKFALIREALKFLLFGRQAQRDGILDYIKGVWGWKNAKQPQKVEYPKELSIIAINYQTTQLTLNLLESIFRKSSGFDKSKHEIIILDNSPEKSCRQEVLRKYPNIKFIQNEVNNGFARANNQMIDYSLGKNILMLNSDIEVDKKSISTLVKTSKKFDDEAVLAGKLLFPNGDDQDSCFYLPTVWGAIKEYFLKIKGSYFMYYPLSKRITKIEAAAMAAFFIPGKILNKIGQLNSKLFMYFEDVDYCRRLKWAKVPVYYCPEARFYHHHGASGRKIADAANQWRRLIPSSKIYHGIFVHFLLFVTLWLGQKWGRVTTPVPRWTKEK